jgi:hypothetical protein
MRCAFGKNQESAETVEETTICVHFEWVDVLWRVQSAWNRNKAAMQPSDQGELAGVMRRRYVFTICLCISPDLDGNRGTTKPHHDMFHDMFVH